MRIAMIGPKRIPSREGGIDVVVGKLSTEISKKGEKVTIFVRKNKSNKKQKEYNGCAIKPTFTINKKSTDAIIYSFFATLKGLFGKYDVLHFHAEGNTFFLWMTRWSRKKIVCTCHGIDWKRGKFKGFGSKILLKAEKRMVKYSDAIITLCKNDSDYFMERYGRKTVLIPNGFEEYNLTKPDIITQKYGLKGDDYILFLSRIVPEKGLHYLIKAYSELDIPQRLIVAGGSSNSQSYYSEMVELANNNPKITFTGFVEGLELEELVSNAFLFVLPSDIEGMSMSLLEALGHKRICLVSDIEENKVDLDNSYFFKHGNVESLKEKLVEISKNKKTFIEKGDSSMNWDKVTEATIDLYKELLWRNY